MRRINPEYVKAIVEIGNDCPYFKLLSMSIESIGEGSSELVIDLEEKHLQPFGMAHGGVFSSLIDAAAFWAVFAELEEDKGLTTLEMKLNYLAPVQKGRIVGKGRRIKMGSTTGLAEATITDENGRLLSHGTVTLLLIPHWEYGAGKITVPKYI